MGSTRSVFDPTTIVHHQSTIRWRSIQWMQLCLARCTSLLHLTTPIDRCPVFQTLLQGTRPRAQACQAKLQAEHFIDPNRRRWQQRGCPTLPWQACGLRLQSQAGISRLQDSRYLGPRHPSTRQLWRCQVKIQLQPSTTRVRWSVRIVRVTRFSLNLQLNALPTRDGSESRPDLPCGFIRFLTTLTSLPLPLVASLFCLSAPPMQQLLKSQEMIPTKTRWMVQAHATFPLLVLSGWLWNGDPKPKCHIQRPS
ncbi:hypothetical protein JVT61DRAFT_9052 [Boletus reticuloceps]|uniref:Uncharacterized protein n=1 Tax=Boletus reticuloceps TaxID=495285 RepID=A0A8I3A4Y6_9AGAM|nr:hypothetical protein JVT61DRAFT_9052 [Boletus reticuloceps]